MKAIMNWLEKYVVPVAVKIGSIKWLVALRDAFIGTMPATMAGSIAVLLNAFLRDFPTEWGWTGFVNAMAPVVAVNGVVWTGTIAVIGLIFAFSWGYNLSHVYGVDALSGGIVGLGAYLMSVSSAVVLNLPKALPAKAVKIITDAGGVTDGRTITTGGIFQMGQLGATGLFTAMLFGGLATVIYIRLMKANIIIKMPDTVPPAVSKAFAAIIPATVAFYVVGIINYLFTKATGSAFIDWLSKTIQEPLLHASQGFGMVILITILVQIFWFFGIHGTNVLAPIIESIWTTAQLANVDAAQKGIKIPYMWVRGSFDIYAWIGGAGGTLLLIAAILVFSKRADNRTVAKLSLAPGLFNINEPIMFGLPIVLNAIYFIPFILAPVVMVSIGYFATYLGIVGPVKFQVLWVMPPLINAFLATGDWMAPIVALVTMAVGFLIYVPFVLAANRIDEGE